MKRLRLALVLLLALAVLARVSTAGAQTTTTSSTTTTTAAPVPCSQGGSGPCLMQHDTYSNQGGVQSYVVGSMDLPEGYAGNKFDMSGQTDTYLDEVFSNTTDYPLTITGISGYQPGFSHSVDYRVLVGTQPFGDGGCATLAVCEFAAAGTAGVYVSDYTAPIFFNVSLNTGAVTVPPHTLYAIGSKAWGMRANVPAFSLGDFGQVDLCATTVATTIGTCDTGAFMHGAVGYLGDYDPNATSSTTTTNPVETFVCTGEEGKAYDLKHGGVKIDYPSCHARTTGTAVAPTGTAGGTPPDGACDGFWCVITNLGSLLADIVNAIAAGLGWIADALAGMASALAGLASAIGAIATQVAQALQGLLSYLFKPSAGKVNGLIDPFKNTTFLTSAVGLAQLPASMVTAAQSSVGSPCPTEFTFSGHSFGLCQSLAAVEGAGDWSSVRLVVLGGLVFLVIVALYRRLTDRLAS